MFGMDIKELSIGDVLYRVSGYGGNYDKIDRVELSRKLKNSVVVKNRDGVEFRYTFYNNRWGEKRGTWSRHMDYLVTVEDGEERLRRHGAMMRLKNLISDAKLVKLPGSLNRVLLDRDNISIEAVEDIISSMKEAIMVLENGLKDGSEP